MTEGADPKEKELVSCEQGKALADAWAKRALDPKVIEGVKDIPSALLASEDIKKVILATGAIAPFYVGGGRNSRLKKASYEGRIGRKAFEYRNLKRLKLGKREFNIPFLRDKFELVDIYSEKNDKGLVVPKNGIVFVETDIDFNLPDFLALRFNLQIKHVHRGLLLGTGPLARKIHRGLADVA